jgi:uncharacterized protein (TIGR04442 family)
VTIQDIRLHGFIPDKADRYEYFATVVGPGLNLRFFYEQGEDTSGPRDRFFLGSNELALYSNHIYHRGNGGTFCNYMLGLQQPVKDLLKPEVRNRLVMYGARYDNEGEHIIFSKDTNGQESYERIFNEGHAFANYYFFVAGDIQGDLKTVQETVLRLTGKFLKRSDLSNDIDGSFLAERLYREIDIARWTLFVLKLIDRYSLDYHKKFVELYANGRWIDSAGRERLSSLSRQYRLKAIECDRLELDAIYKHQENKQLIENYKQVLIARYKGIQDDNATQSKRKRLRTLGTQRHLPPLLFDKLDRMLQPRQAVETPASLLEARRGLEKIFAGSNPQKVLDEEHLVMLLRARLDALDHHYGGFDDLLTEIGRTYRLDSSSRNGSATELFSAIAGHLERFEAAYGTVNSVALIDDYELTEERLFLLARTKDIIDNVRPRLFDELIFQTVESHRYLNIYGRERLHKLKNGIDAILTGEQEPEQVVSAISRITGDMRLRRVVEAQLRDRMRDVYQEPLDKKEQEFLRGEINRKLIKEGALAEPITPDLFASAVFAIREEYLYLDELLPQIISNRDRQLRQDFLENSALDRFRTEELEQQYLRKHKLSPDALDWLAGCDR